MRLAAIKVDVEGAEELSEGGRLGAATGTRYQTPVRTLDSYALEDVGFIKIDVEGGDDGLRATIAEVQAMGYACSFMWQGEELGTDRFDLATHQLRPQQAGDLRRAVKDFIFRARPALGEG